jgi:hypothetical protein
LSGKTIVPSALISTVSLTDSSKWSVTIFPSRCQERAR